MIELSATVRNKQGIHCRPSSVIAKAVMGYSGRVVVRGDAGECDPRSLMSLLLLELRQGSRVRVEVDGDDEEAMCTRLVELFETHFDFPPREKTDVDQVKA